MPRALLGCAPRRTLRKTLNATKRTLQRTRSDAARALGVRAPPPEGSDAARALGVRAPPDSPEDFVARALGVRAPPDSPEDSKRH